MEPPAKARINVFDMVPIISFPTRIPEKNKPFTPNSGFWWDISYIVEEMDIATSMTAPNDAIKIPANKSWPTSIPVWSLT